MSDWAPDGGRLVFQDLTTLKTIEPDGTDQPSGRGSVWAVRPDGTDRHVLVPATRERAFFKAVWSPDGDQLLTVCARRAAASSGCA
jgi:Tol biopolymer transport system component